LGLGLWDWLVLKEHEMSLKEDISPSELERCQASPKKYRTPRSTSTKDLVTFLRLFWRLDVVAKDAPRMEPVM